MSAAAEFVWRRDPAESNFRLWFASAPLCFARLDAEGNLIERNPSLSRILEEAGKGSPLRFIDLIDSELESECQQLMEEIFAAKRNSFQIESRSRIGKLAAMRWTVWRVPGRNKPDYAVAFAEIREKDADSEARLRQLMRLESVGRLAAGVAHDFNNVLTGLLLYCDLLLASLQDQQARKYAEQIRSAGVQAAGVVRQLLNVARPGTRQLRALSLNEVVEAVRDLLSRLIGENIQLELRLDLELGLVRLDYAQAQQILLNLVLNARDAMPAGGRIAIETRNCDIEIFHGSGTRLPCVVLTVRDDGIGMDAATRARMFEAFFTTKGKKGTGLGMAGVYEIVTSNGGLIHVDSTPRAGTRVNVLLPLAAESTTSSSCTQEPAVESNQQLLPINQEA
jgi:two-component system cell cycle sensor histidine kinase/response regulator CckA